ncbi:hypothetical protein DXG01_015841 [Tephrocybe rancida]|nr:hypothetical protein DXG01_015841 [Tephrocybe rancida]
MAYPTSPIAQGFDLLDLNSLARITSKTFERLAPYTLLQNPSSLEARPAVIKTVNKVKAYIEAIDTSIQVVHIAYQMSKAAAALWSASTASNDKQTLKERMEHQKRLEDIVILADDAHEKAQKICEVFKQVQQDFYRVRHLVVNVLIRANHLSLAKIAASTKSIDSTVQIPVDPALLQFSFDRLTKFTAKLIKKPLKDIGVDLVSNLSLLADYTRCISDLTAWCGWVKSSIIAIDGTVVPPQDGSFDEASAIRPQWDRVRADCLIYQSMIFEIQERYSSMLPISTNMWRVTLHEINTSAKATQLGGTGENMRRQPSLSRKVSTLLQDVVRHLSCHTQGCFAV